MTVQEFKSWQAVQEEVMRRIKSRIWEPGAAIPNEADLSIEFGCARATVNRALQNLADVGILDRRRKAGTRVALYPVFKVTLQIPILRLEIENLGHKFGYRFIRKETAVPPQDIAKIFMLEKDKKALKIEAVYLADQKPFVFEDRWINLEMIPQAMDIDYTTISANEWLVTNVPFDGGDINICAVNADDYLSQVLECQPNDALFLAERTTKLDSSKITYVNLYFRPGYKIHTSA